MNMCLNVPVFDVSVEDLEFSDCNAHLQSMIKCHAVYSAMPLTCFALPVLVIVLRGIDRRSNHCVFCCRCRCIRHNVFPFCFP